VWYLNTIEYPIYNVFMDIRILDQKFWKAGSYQSYSHNLALLLRMKDTLLIFNNGHPPYNVVLGVPHQAALGESKIAEDWVMPNGNSGRDSDENAASYALVAYSLLCDLAIPCKLVIACHFTDHDPNKDCKSPYCHEILSETTKLLLECHGAGDKRKSDIEISAGMNKLGRPLEFGRCLAEKMDYRFKIAAQIRGGTNKALTILEKEELKTKLSLPALKSTSLSLAEDYGIPALHLEAKPKFRIPHDENVSVTPQGDLLGKAIASIIQ
jgi:hypothetical protein